MIMPLFQRSDDELRTMNNVLASLEQTLIDRHTTPQKQTYFIIGLPRSGTTLLSQLLIKHFNIGYVSNFIARFWECPALGATIQKQLFDGQPSLTTLDSNFGMTDGNFGPHEFGFFWRRWFDYKEHDFCEKGNDSKKMLAEIAALEHALEQPMLFKNLAACGMHAHWLSRVLPKAKFILLRRNPQDTAQSILSARINYSGSEKDWFSIRPPGYAKIKRLPYDEQIAQQILHTDLHLASQLSNIDCSRYLTVHYEDLLQDAGKVLNKISSFIDIEPINQEMNIDLTPKTHEKKSIKLHRAVEKIVSTNPEWTNLFFNGN